MFIKYVEGPDKIKILPLGEFKRDVSREVSEELGQKLLKKNSLKWMEIKDTSKKEKGGK